MSHAIRGTVIVGCIAVLLSAAGPANAAPPKLQGLDRPRHRRVRQRRDRLRDGFPQRLRGRCHPGARSPVRLPLHGVLPVESQREQLEVCGRHHLQGTGLRQQLRDRLAGPEQRAGHALPVRAAAVRGPDDRDLPACARSLCGSGMARCPPTTPIGAGSGTPGRTQRATRTAPSATSGERRPVGRQRKSSAAIRSS
jgi:hypothetical protein